MKNITIFIHGTFPHNLFPNPLSMLSEKILYRYFHCPPSLNKATSLEKDLHIRAMAETISQADPQQFPLEDFYTFGWPGELDFDQREQAAQDLHTALKKLVKQYGEKPHITIITHSHGGNVALNLGKIPDRDWSIDELILLACPVQEQTAQFIKNPSFKNIYSLHSHSDILQIGDPQGWQRLIESLGSAWEEKSFAPLTSTQLTPFFSERHFRPHEKLAQVHLTFEGRNPFHFEFLYLDFMNALPRILNKIKNYKQHANYTPEQELVLESTE